MIDSLVKSKDVNGSLYQTRLLHRSYFDISVHQPPSFEDIEQLDISTKWNRLQPEVSHLDAARGKDYGHSHTNFDALMRAYYADFYGYL